MMAPDAGMFPPSTSHVLPSKAVDGKEKRTIANPKDRTIRLIMAIVISTLPMVTSSTSTQVVLDVTCLSYAERENDRPKDNVL